MSHSTMSPSCGIPVAPLLLAIVTSTKALICIVTNYKLQHELKDLEYDTMLATLARSTKGNQVTQTERYGVKPPWSCLVNGCKSDCLMYRVEYRAYSSYLPSPREEIRGISRHGPRLALHLASRIRIAQTVSQTQSSYRSSLKTFWPKRMLQYTLAL